jgi:hypothetical protein
MFAAHAYLKQAHSPTPSKPNPQPTFNHKTKTQNPQHINKQDAGVFSAKPQTRGMHETMMTDPSVMSDMMKRNLSGVVPQVGGRFCLCT